MKFKGKIWKTGDGNVVTVPSQYIKDGYLKFGEEYTITLEKENGKEN